MKNTLLVGVLILGTIIGRDGSEQARIQSLGLAPADDRESAILATLAAGTYTAIARGVNNTTGNALVDVYNIQ